MMFLAGVAITAVAGLIWIVTRPELEPRCPSWSDFETRELIEAALSWQRRRARPGDQDRRLDTALRNWRGRWNR